jgi:hypothetical protein
MSSVDGVKYSLPAESLALRLDPSLPSPLLIWARGAAVIAIRLELVRETD